MYISYMFCAMTLAFPDDALKFLYELLFLLPCRGKGIPYIQVGVSVSINKVEDYIYSFAHYLIFSLPTDFKYWIKRQSSTLIIKKIFAGQICSWNGSIYLLYIHELYIYLQYTYAYCGHLHYFVNLYIYFIGS